MNMRIVRSLPEEDWGRFVAGHPQGTVFHTPEMFRVFDRVPGYRPELWAALEEDRILALWLPVQITLKSGLFRAFTTRSVVFGGALCVPEKEGREALSFLLGAYDRGIRGSPLLTESRNISDAAPYQAVFREHGFVFEEHLNYHIDLNRTEQDLWKSLSRSCRRNVRLARSRGLVVEDIIEAGSVGSAYGLLRDVFSRVRVPLAGPELFAAALEILRPRGMLKALVARADGRDVGARFVLTYKGTIIDWFGGSDRQYARSYPEESLIWEILRWGRERGFHLFDFGGAGKPDEYYGPREFKARWGGALVNYGRNTRIHGNLRIHLSKAAYQLCRGCFKKKASGSVNAGNEHSAPDEK